MNNKIFLFIILIVILTSCTYEGYKIDRTNIRYCINRSECPCLISDTSETIIDEQMIKDCCNNETNVCHFEGAKHIFS